MQISKEWCGFTGGQADTLRKAVGKKKIDLMRKIKPEFVEGAVTVGGATEEMAELFWDQLEEFANYCFNKSHAACYGLIAYWTAYLKAHYPDAFMAALMTSDQDDIDRLAIEISECKHMGIKVLSPDVNESYVEFAIVPDKKQIRFGLAAVKGIGVGAVEEILRAREDARFSTIEDFARRVSTSKVNRRVWESLIKSGGFDSLGDRSDLLFNLDNILAFASKLQKEALSGQTDIFGMFSDNASIRPSVEIKPAPTKYTEKEQLMWERELLGLYISAHPLDNYDDFFEEQTVPLHHLAPLLDGHPITVGGLVSTIRTIITKSGSKMAFVGIEDRTGEAEIIVFPKIYEKLGSALEQDAFVKVVGRASARDKDGNLMSEVKIIAESIDIISDKELKDYQSTGRKMAAPSGRPKVTAKRRFSSTPTVVASASMTVAPVVASVVLKKLYIHIKDPNDHKSLLAIKQACGKYPGDTDVVMVLGSDKKSAIKLPFRVDPSAPLLGDLVAALGEDAVALK